MKIFSKTMCAASLMALSFAPAQATQVAVGPKLGTLGIGLEASAKVNDYFSLNAGINGFKISKGLHKSDVKYDGHLRLLTIGATANFHPFKNGFKLTGGAFYNLNEFELTATPSTNITLFGNTYTPAQVGRLTGSVDFRKISPYVGIGYDSAFYNDSPWSFNGEIGVMFQGTPRVKISASGLLGQNPQMLRDLNADAQKAADKPYFKFYPVISVGVKYRF